MVAVHANALLNKHASLDAQIRMELSRPNPDETFLRELKRRKLRIKDELAVH